MTSGLTMQNPFLVRLPLNLEIWKEIQITANDQRKEGSTIKIRSPIYDPIHPYRFVLKHDVILWQKDQIDVAKSSLGKPGQNIEFFGTWAAMRGDDGKIEIAVGPPAAGRQRPEKVNGLNVRKLRKNRFQTLEIWLAHLTSTPLAILVWFYKSATRNSQFLNGTSHVFQTNCDRNVAAGTIKGEVCSKQSRETKGKPAAT